MNRPTYDKLLSNIDTLRAEFRDPERVDEDVVRELAARIFQLAHGHEPVLGPFTRQEIEGFLEEKK